MGDFWKPTADMFGTLFEKPKMSDRLLMKPPFKYIFDILQQTTNQTGFGKGLYQGNEAKAEYYADKDKKMAFLQKSIKLVEMMTGKQLDVKPQKIVAGLEPENTNLWLQAYYKCAKSGKSSDPYVKKILGVGGAEEEQKPADKKIGKVERPSSAMKNKKKGSEQTVEEPPKQQIHKQQQQKQDSQRKKIASEKETKIGSDRKDEKKSTKKVQGSKKVQELLKEGQLEQQAQRLAQQQSRPAQKKGINLGTLGSKNKKKEQQTISTTGQLTSKELELLQNMIQTICHNTAPLGKSIEFVHDDIDAMNKELASWRRQYNASKNKMSNELKITEDALLPIYDKIAEVEDSIRDQKAKIQTTKAQIIKNQATIKTLLMSVVTIK